MSANDLLKKKFEEWVINYTDILYSIALYKTSKKEIAEDLVQETFMSAYSNIESFKGESNPKTWLQSILNNKIVDYYRKKAKEIISPIESDLIDHIAATDALFNDNGGWSSEAFKVAWSDDKHLLDNSQFNEVMERCMDDLPNSWQHAVQAKFIYNKNSNQICQELEISASNYWQILHRAKLLLKKCLELNWFKIN